MDLGDDCSTLRLQQCSESFLPSADTNGSELDAGRSCRTRNSSRQSRWLDRVSLKCRALNLYPEIQHTTKTKPDTSKWYKGARQPYGLAVLYLSTSRPSRQLADAAQGGVMDWRAWYRGTHGPFWWRSFDNESTVRRVEVNQRWHFPFLVWRLIARIVTHWRLQALNISKQSVVLLPWMESPSEYSSLSCGEVRL